MDEFVPSGSLVIVTREILEEALGIRVVNFPGRYLEALTHKSAAAELGRPSYERLEYLGDAVISFVVAKYLIDQFPGENEGFLTRVRTRMTCSATLSDLGHNLQLHKFVFMNGKALKAGWNANDRVMEDCLEALVGAIYLDCGLLAAQTFFLSLLMKNCSMEDLLKDVNFKDILLRSVQSHGQPLPEYVADQKTICHGGKNLSMFFVTVNAGGVVARGLHSTKKGAEQKAARAALVSLGHTLD